MILTTDKIKMFHLRSLYAIKFILQIFLLLSFQNIFHFLPLHGLLNNSKLGQSLFFPGQNLFKIPYIVNTFLLVSASQAF